MTNYTRGTLRPRRDDEYPTISKEQLSHVYDFDVKTYDRMKREHEVIGKLVAVALIVMFGVAIFIWGTT